MKKILTLSIFAALLQACDSADRPEDQIRGAVKAQLKDPDSAKFGNIAIHNNLACIYVNAKNSFGGYTGQQVARLSRIGSTWSVTNIGDGSCSQVALGNEYMAETIAEKCRENAVKEDYSTCMTRNGIR